MQSYCIPIPNEKAATYKVVTFIISLINLIAFLYVLLRGDSKLWILFLAGLLFSLVAVLLFVVNWYFAKIKWVNPAAFILISSLCWILAGIYVLGILLFIFSIISLYTSKALVITFTDEGILYPSFPVKMIGWQEVDFVILKDDILTIELKNNKLLQFTLESEVAALPDTGEFNAYCANQRLA
jgi:ABC-type transport system involved in multi-copper enzyme maturation permease subunit